MKSLVEAARPYALVFAVSWLVGCAGADGGPIGTGITASVAGNVVAVVEDASAAVEGSVFELPEIIVSIDGLAGVETTTDADGNFVLEGDFAGELNLRFRAPGVEAAREIDVPTGALVVLSDVVLAPGEIDVEAGRQVGLVARVVSLDCASGVLELEDDRGRPPGRFSVQLLEETLLLRHDAGEIACAQIATGENVSVDGVFDPDPDAQEGLTALSVTAGVSGSSRSEVVEGVPFLGFASAIDCLGGTLTVADASQRTRLRLTNDTEIVRRSGAAIGCGELAVGDRVAGLGRLRVRRPGRIEATNIVATASAQGSIEIRLAGVVVGKDCAAPALQIDDGDSVAVVRLRPETQIDPRLSCEEIRVGARVRGLGRLGRAMPGLVDAVRLELRPPGRTP
jgi:hypothetical protein